GAGGMKPDVSRTGGSAMSLGVALVGEPPLLQPAAAPRSPAIAAARIKGRLMFIIASSSAPGGPGELHIVYLQCFVQIDDTMMHSETTPFRGLPPRCARPREDERVREPDLVIGPISLAQFARLPVVVAAAQRLQPPERGAGDRAARHVHATNCLIV